MLVIDYIIKATRQLEEAGIGTARLDALVLIEDVSAKDRAWLLAHPEFELTAEQTDKLKNLLNARASHTPLAYVRGKTEFYGRTFLINNSVLEPRPESEAMIDLLKKSDLDSLLGKKTGPKTAGLQLADVGTGSGALGITAKLELPELEVELLDIDPGALEVAKMNVDLFTLNISIIESDLLSNSSRTSDILLCNLPYVPDNFQINTAASHEPRVALFGGPDGLDLYRRLFSQINEMPKHPLLILTESMPPQHGLLTAVASKCGYALQESQDFIQVFRFGG
jgi:release factor glutamine methyltransferase